MQMVRVMDNSRELFRLIYLRIEKLRLVHYSGKTHNENEKQRNQLTNSRTTRIT